MGKVNRYSDKLSHLLDYKGILAVIQDCFQTESVIALVVLRFGVCLDFLLIFFFLIHGNHRTSNT